jgi:hypothetical protein
VHTEPLGIYITKLARQGNEKPIDERLFLTPKANGLGAHEATRHVARVAHIHVHRQNETQRAGPHIRKREKDGESSEPSRTGKLADGHS